MVCKNFTHLSNFLCKASCTKRHGLTLVTFKAISYRVDFYRSVLSGKSRWGQHELLLGQSYLRDYENTKFYLPIARSWRKWNQKWAKYIKRFQEHKTYLQFSWPLAVSRIRFYEVVCHYTLEAQTIKFRDLSNLGTRTTLQFSSPGPFSHLHHHYFCSPDLPLKFNLFPPYFILSLKTFPFNNLLGQ